MSNSCLFGEIYRLAEAIWYRNTTMLERPLDERCSVFEERLVENGTAVLFAIGATLLLLTVAQIVRQGRRRRRVRREAAAH